MATKLKVKCIDQTLTLVGTPIVASGGRNEDIIEFEFCEKWDGFTKVCVFYQNKGEIYYALVDENDIAVVPQEVINTKGTMYFGVIGVKGDVRRTSQVLSYKILNGALDGFTIEDPTPSIYEQILTRLNRIENETIPNSIEEHNTSNNAHEDMRSDIEIIESKIPNQATSENQLADKEFVNSSIATNTAYFKGTFNIVDDLELSRDATHEQVASALASVIEEATNNDYTFVAIPNATITTQIDQYDRYKYNGTSWVFEFTLNNSSFTANQWNAINSGITGAKVTQIETNKNDISDLQQNKQDKLVSGTNIKTINGNSLLGGGDISVSVQLDQVYPVGSIYMSVNNANPSTLFGGTWEQLKDRFLLGCGDTYQLGETGGEAEHTLTIAEMPSHTHSFSAARTNGECQKGTNYYAATSGGGNTGATGGGEAHNNMPPYLAVNMWKRTA